MERETVVNNALEMAGIPTRIQSLWDGSPQALIARDLWEHVRDASLAIRPWEFARDYAALTESELGPIHTWLYRWVRPTQAITILDVYSSTTSQYIVTPFRWVETYNIDYGRDIFTDFDAARASMTRRVLDVADWSPEFTAVMIAGLAERFVQVFGEHNGADARGRGEQRPRRDGVS